MRHRLVRMAASLSLALGACQPSAPALPQQAYIWQRQWSDAHAQALTASRNMFSGFRVLAAQMHPREGLVRARVDPGVLAADGRPITAVLRLDGELNALDAASMRSMLGEIVNQWRANRVNLVGIEIDYDCATSRLPDYAQFLRELRGQIANDLTFSITVLPSWMESSALPAVLGQVDHAVLQVHSVLSADRGLFDANKARTWIARFAALSPVPYWIALPSYGSGLVRDRGGKTHVESERPLPIAGLRTELRIDPQGMQDFLLALKDERPSHVLGVVWFRLPMVGDDRGWRLSTLSAVIDGSALNSAMTLRLQRRSPADELVVDNVGTLDAPMPGVITVRPADCEAADALAGYSLQRDSAGLVFRRIENATLRADGQRVIGWLRCRNPDAEILHAEP